MEDLILIRFAFGFHLLEAFAPIVEKVDVADVNDEPKTVAQNNSEINP